MNYVLNKSENRIAFGIYGEIGTDVDGHALAREINATEGQYSEIHVHINSQGGSVIHGMSIFTALYNCRQKVTTHIDGVALSMAGIIATVGKEVKMNDFGRLMIHNPFLPDKEKNKAMSDGEKTMLESLKGMLTEIFVNMRGIRQQFVETEMAAETWYTSKEAKKAGLVDEIVITGKKAFIADAANGKQMVDVMNSLINNLKTQTMELKKLTEVLNLAETTPEDKVLEAIQNKDTKIAELSGKVTDLEAKMANPGDYVNADLSMKLGFKSAVTVDRALDAIGDMAAKAELADKLEAKFNSLLDDRINEILSAAVADRKFPATQKGYYKTLLKGDFENGKRIIAGLNPVQRIADFVKSDGMASQDRSKWTWKDYQEKDPKALLRLQDEIPEMFAALYQDNYGKAYVK